MCLLGNEEQMHGLEKREVICGLNQVKVFG